jgi:hypothetical protein
VADGGEDDVGGIALAALKMAAAEVTVGLHVSDHGLDGAAASQFAFDDAEDAALLARNEDAAWIGCAVTTISLVDIGTFDLTAGKPFRFFDHDAQCVAIIGIGLRFCIVVSEAVSLRSGAFRPAAVRGPSTATRLLSWPAA